MRASAKNGGISECSRERRQQQQQCGDCGDVGTRARTVPVVILYLVQVLDLGKQPGEFTERRGAELGEEAARGDVRFVVVRFVDVHRIAQFRGGVVDCARGGRVCVVGDGRVVVKGPVVVVDGRGEARRVAFGWSRVMQLLLMSHSPNLRHEHCVPIGGVGEIGKLATRRRCIGTRKVHKGHHDCGRLERCKKARCSPMVLCRRGSGRMHRLEIDSRF